jgi:hypothetical protein
MQAVAEVEHTLVAALLVQAQLAAEMVVAVPQEHVEQIPIIPEMQVPLEPMDSVVVAAADLYLQVEQMTRSVATVDLELSSLDLLQILHP